MNMFKLSLSSVEIPVAQLDRAISWYGEALGYACEWSDSHHAMLACMNSAESSGRNAPRILLVETNDISRLSFKSTHTNLQHSVIDFETDNLESVHAHLSKFIQDLEPIPVPANGWAPRGFGFSDCDGNRLAIFSYAATTGTREHAAL